jgi:hypothetical protein
MKASSPEDTAEPAPEAGAIRPEKRVARGRALLLILLLLPAVALKLWFNPTLGIGADDAAFYYQIARHVSEGDGLQTSVSLYHQGLKHLPQRSTIYPLWPLLLGYTGKLIGLERAAAVLPEAFYFLSLLLFYAFANKLASSLYGSGAESIGESGITIGHVGVLLFAYNRIYFLNSSPPFTEPLGMTLLLLALLAVERSDREVGVRWAGIAGLLAGAAYLCRYQFFILPIIICVALWYPARKAGGSRKAFAAAGASVLLILPWLIYVSTFVPRFSPSLILDFSAVRESPELEPMAWMVPSEGVFSTVWDRLSGLAVAFSPSDPDSYIASFGAIAYLVPLVALLAVLTRGRSNDRRARASSFLIASLATAVILVLLVHTFHQRLFNPWMFGQRHGLYFIVVIVWAVIYAIRRGPALLAAFALFLVVWSVTTSLLSILVTVQRGWPQKPTMEARTFARWADRDQGVPTIISTRPQALSALSGANFHWIACVDSPETLLALQRAVRADYVVVFPIDERCRFLAGWQRDFEQVKVFGQGSEKIRLLAPRSLAPSATDQ